MELEVSRPAGIRRRGHRQPGHSRKATVLAVAIPAPPGEQVKAHAPLARLFGYSTTLRSLTQGRGSFAMTFTHFAPRSDPT